jgi:8-amino-7-oxononanoate synthase
MHPLAWLDDELNSLQERHLLRHLPAPLERPQPVIEVAGRQLVNFASNDYLGLAADPRLQEAAASACLDSGVGRGASPLVCGRSKYHEELERRLTEFEGVEAALLFPSGFAANSGVIPALVDRGDSIYADAKNHASLIDGCRLSRANVHVYPHGDVCHLEELLAEDRDARRRLIVTDTLFSMDGDLPPLTDIIELAGRFNAMLLLDEAHATGVFGAHGRGVAESLGAKYEGLIRIGTLSKALGAAGGFVCGSKSLIRWLANRARSYVFSTAQPGAISAAAIAALDIVEQEPQRRVKLLETAAWLRDKLNVRGWNTGRSQSQIIPINLGSPERAVSLSQQLRECGYWLPAIRPPSVPEGESLLRLSLTAAHTSEMLNGILSTLEELADHPHDST